RANDQIAMLKEISEKQSAQIDLLIALAHKKEEPEKDYLEEARKKAGLI
ncbi:YebO family protein, partial [Klebsiella pneumoniae]